MIKIMCSIIIKSRKGSSMTTIEVGHEELGDKTQKIKLWDPIQQNTSNTAQI